MIVRCSPGAKRITVGADTSFAIQRIYCRELRNLRGKVREVIGADIDPIVATNPCIDRAIVVGKATNPIAGRRDKGPGCSAPATNACSAS